MASQEPSKPDAMDGLVEGTAPELSAPVFDSPGTSAEPTPVLGGETTPMLASPETPTAVSAAKSTPVLVAGSPRADAKVLERHRVSASDGPRPSWCCCGNEPPAIELDPTGSSFPPLGESRKCTDVFCLLLFLMYWMGMAAIAYLGFRYGDGKRLVYGTDHLGNVCDGVSEGCGSGVCGGAIFYPTQDRDALMQAASADISEMKLFGLCVDRCPEQGTFICDYSVEESLNQTTRDAVLRDCLVETSTVSAGIANFFGVAAPGVSATCRRLMSGCWFVSQRQRELFFRCFEDPVANETISSECAYPATQVADPSLRNPAFVCEDETRVMGELPEVCEESVCLARTGAGCISNPRCTHRKRTYTMQTVVPVTGGSENGLQGTLVQQVSGAASTFERYLGDLRETWVSIVVTGGIAPVFLGLAWLVMLQSCLGLFVWTMVASSFAALLGLTLIAFYKSGTMEGWVSDVWLNLTGVDVGSMVDEHVDFALTGISEVTDADVHRDAWKALGITLSVVDSLYFVVLLTQRKRIKIAIAIYQEAAKAVRSAKSMLLMPLLMTIVAFGVFVYGVVVFAYFYTAADMGMVEIAPGMPLGGIGVNNSTLNRSTFLDILDGPTPTAAPVQPAPVLSAPAATPSAGEVQPSLPPSAIPLYNFTGNVVVSGLKVVTDEAAMLSSMRLDLADSLVAFLQAETVEIHLASLERSANISREAPRRLEIFGARSLSGNESFTLLLSTLSANYTVLFVDTADARAAAGIASGLSNTTQRRIYLANLGDEIASRESFNSSASSLVVEALSLVAAEGVPTDGVQPSTAPIPAGPTMQPSIPSPVNVSTPPSESNDDGSSKGGNETTQPLSTSTPSVALTPEPTRPISSAPSLPTSSPTGLPTFPGQTLDPTISPSVLPTVKPSSSPTSLPTFTDQTSGPTSSPSDRPTAQPSSSPTSLPTLPGQTLTPTYLPSVIPTAAPSVPATGSPTRTPSTGAPSEEPTVAPTSSPSTTPTSSPSASPTALPSVSGQMLTVDGCFCQQEWVSDFPSPNGTVETDFCNFETDPDGPWCLIDPSRDKPGTACDSTAKAWGRCATFFPTMAPVPTPAPTFIPTAAPSASPTTSPTERYILTEGVMVNILQCPVLSQFASSSVTACSTFCDMASISGCTMFTFKPDSPTGTCVLFQSCDATQPSVNGVLRYIRNGDSRRLVAGRFSTHGRALNETVPTRNESENGNPVAFTPTASADAIDQITKIIVSDYEHIEGRDAALVYHIFGTLWTFGVLEGLSIATLAGVTSSWYWNGSGDKRMERSPAKLTLASSFRRTVRFHLGSVCFAALLVSIVQLVRAILYYIDRRTKNAQEKNVVVRLVLKIVQCCLWCFEKILKYITRNAYIVMVLYGTNFCTSSFEAVSFIARNAGRVASVLFVGNFVLVLSKFVICSSCGLMEFAWLSYTDAFRPGGESEITSRMLSVLCATLSSYGVATAFLHVYGVTVDTILLCFCIDMKLNRKSKNYCMSVDLKNFFRRASRNKMARLARKRAQAIQQVGPEPLEKTPTSDELLNT